MPSVINFRCGIFVEKNWSGGKIGPSPVILLEKRSIFPFMHLPRVINKCASLSRENRSLLLLLISRLKIKQIRCEGWDDCATLATSNDYLRERAKNDGPVRHVDHAKKKQLVKVTTDERGFPRLFFVRARIQLTLHNQTQSAGRENQFVVPRRALES